MLAGNPLHSIRSPIFKPLKFECALKDPEIRCGPSCLYSPSFWKYVSFATCSQLFICISLVPAKKNTYINIYIYTFKNVILCKEKIQKKVGFTADLSVLEDSSRWNLGLFTSKTGNPGHIICQPSKCQSSFWKMNAWARGSCAFKDLWPPPFKNTSRFHSLWSLPQKLGPTWGYLSSRGWALGRCRGAMCPQLCASRHGVHFGEWRGAEGKIQDHGRSEGLEDRAEFTFFL